MFACPPWPRAALTATVVMAAAVGLHRLGGGSVPAVPAGVALVLLIFAIRWLQGAPGSAWRTTAVLLAGQAAVHIALTPMAAHHGDGMAAHRAAALVEPLDGHAAHETALRHSHDALGPQLVGWVGDAFACLDPRMVLAHVAAAAFAGAWLAAGERRVVAAAWMVGELARAWWRRGVLWLASLALPVPDRGLSRLTPGPDSEAPRTAAIIWSTFHRGPPAAQVA